MEKTHVFILSSSSIIAESLAKSLSTRDQSFEPIILIKADEIATHSSVVDTLRDKQHKDCLFILASDNSSNWLRWLYDIRCKKKFRGPCYFLFAEEHLEPAAKQLKKLLFADYIKSYQDMFHYTELFHLISKAGTVKFGLTFTRLRRIQRSVRRLYLATAHF